MDTRIDRRSFLAASAALAASALVGRAADKADDPFGGFTVGIQTYTFRKFSFEQALDRTKGLGLTNAELFRGHVPTDSKPEAIKAAKKLCADYGVTPVSFGVENFTKDHDANKKLFDFGAALGVKALSANPSADSFDSLDKLVDEYKIAIAIHPHGPAGGKERHQWWSAEVILKAVKNHHELIGTCLDTGHLIRMDQLGEKLDPAAEVRTMGARNFGLHLKDHDNKRKEDVIFGDEKGRLDVLAVLKALREVKFKGYIAIEYEANADNPTDDVKKCLDYFKDQVKKLKA